MKPLYSIIKFLVVYVLMGVSVVWADIIIEKQGWYLIGPGEVTNLDDFMDQSEEVKSIWFWTGKSWEVKFREPPVPNPYAEIKQLEVNKGYWFQTEGETIIPSTSGNAFSDFSEYQTGINSDWNLLSTSSEIDNVVEFFKDLPEGSTVWSWKGNEWFVFSSGDTGDNNQFNTNYNTSIGNLRSLEEGQGFWVNIYEEENNTPLPSPNTSGLDGIFEWNEIIGIVYEKTENNQIVPVADVTVTGDEFAVFKAEGFIIQNKTKEELEQNSVVFLVREDPSTILIQSADLNNRSRSRTISDDLVLSSKDGGAKLTIQNLGELQTTVNIHVTPLNTAASIPEPEALNSAVVAGIAISIYDENSNPVEVFDLDEWNGKIQPVVTSFIGNYEGEKLMHMIDGELGAIEVLFFDPETKNWRSRGPAELFEINTQSEDDSSEINANSWGLRPTDESVWLNKPYPYIAFVLNAPHTTRELQFKVIDENELPVEKAAISLNSQGLLLTDIDGFTPVTTFTIPVGVPAMFLNVSHPSYQKATLSILIPELTENKVNKHIVTLKQSQGSVRIAARVNYQEEPVSGAKVSLLTPSVLNAEQINSVKDNNGLLESLSVGKRDNSDYTWHLNIPTSEIPITVQTGSGQNQNHNLAAGSILSKLQLNNYLSGPVTLKIDVLHPIPWSGVGSYGEQIDNGLLVVGLKPEYISYDLSQVDREGSFILSGNYQNGFFNIAPLVSSQSFSVQWKAMIYWNDKNYHQENVNCSEELTSYDYQITPEHQWELVSECKLRHSSGNEIAEVFENIDENAVISNNAFLNSALIDHQINKYFQDIALKWVHNDRESGLPQYIYDGVTVLLIARVNIEGAEMGHAAIPLSVKLPSEVDIKDGVGIIETYLPASFALPSEITQLSLPTYKKTEGVDYNILFKGISHNLTELLLIKAEKKKYLMVDGDENGQQVGFLYENYLKELEVPMELIEGPSEVVLENTNDSLNISWLEVQEATSYRIYCSTNENIDIDNSSTYSIFIVSDEPNSTIEVTPETTYYCQVTYILSDGNESTGSEVVSAYVEATPEITNTITVTDYETDTKTETESLTDTGSYTETETITGNESDSSSETQTVTDIETETLTGFYSDTFTDSMTETNTIYVVNTETETVSSTDSSTSSITGTLTVTETVAESGTNTTSATNTSWNTASGSTSATDTDLLTSSSTDSETGSVSVSETNTGSETATNSVTITQTNSDTATVTETGTIAEDITVYEIERNDSFETAQDADYKVLYRGRRNASDYNDYYLIKTNGSSINVSLSHLNPNAEDSDFFVYIYDSAKTRIDYLDASNGINAQRTVGVIPDQVYYLMVKVNESSTDEEYFLRVESGNENFELEPNSDFDNAKDIIKNTEYIGQKNHSDYYDVFKITASGRAMTINLGHISPDAADSDFSAYIYSASQTKIDYFSALDGVDSALNLGVNSGESYYVKVKVKHAAMGYLYKLKVNFSEDYYEMERNDNFENAFEIQPDIGYMGQKNDSDSNDFFMIKAQDSALNLSFEHLSANSADSDYKVYIYDSKQNNLDYFVSSDGVDYSRTIGVITDSIYYIKIYVSNASSTNKYRFMVNFANDNIELERNDDFDTAQQTQSGKEYYGQRNYNDYYDCYKITAAGNSMTIQLGHLTPNAADSDFSVLVYNSSQVLMDTLSSLDGTDNTVTLGVIPESIYYLKVKVKDAAYDYFYKLNVEFGEDYYEMEPNSNFDKAKNLNSGVEYIGQKNASDSYDYFKITSTGYLIEIYLSHLFPENENSDFYVDIYDNLKNHLDTLTAINGEDKNLFLGVNQGQDYYIRVKVKLADQSSKYKLQVNF